MRRSGKNQTAGPGLLSASLYFHAPPGMGWRLHISKIAAEIRVLPSSGVSDRLRQGKMARND
jgi:hypothetical protein